MQQPAPPSPPFWIAGSGGGQIRRSSDDPRASRGATPAALRDRASAIVAGWPSPGWSMTGRSPKAARAGWSAPAGRDLPSSSIWPQRASSARLRRRACPRTRTRRLSPRSSSRAAADAARSERLRKTADEIIAGPRARGVRACRISARHRAPRAGHGGRRRRSGVSGRLSRIGCNNAKARIGRLIRCHCEPQAKQPMCGRPCGHGHRLARLGGGYLDRVVASMCPACLRGDAAAGQDGFRDGSSKERCGVEAPLDCAECLASWIDRSHHLLLLWQKKKKGTSHGITGWLVPRLVRQMTAVAPTTSRLRSVSSPARVIRPSLVLPAVEWSFGVRPSQAAKWRPERKAYGWASSLPASRQ